MSAEFEPRAKDVPQIQADNQTIVRFSKVTANRCASDASYPVVFEAVRTQLETAGLRAVKSHYDEGWIEAAFRFLLVFTLSLRVTFYSAGASIVIDGDGQPDQGWFKIIRKKRAAQLVTQLSESVLNTKELPGAAAYPPSVHPPEHSI